MNSRTRAIIIAAVTVVTFVTTATVMAHLMPSHKSSTDYMVVGSVATFVSMLVVFFVLIMGYTKKKDVFYSTRKKHTDSEE